MSEEVQKSRRRHHRHHSHSQVPQEEEPVLLKVYTQEEEQPENQVEVTEEAPKRHRRRKSSSQSTPVVEPPEEELPSEENLIEKVLYDPPRVPRAFIPDPIHKERPNKVPFYSKAHFTKEEDQIILDNFTGHNTDWERIARLLGNRSPKNVKDRYCQYLNPTINFAPWTEKEKIMLFELAQRYGTDWRVIHRFFPGRTVSNLKNTFTSYCKRKDVDKKQYIDIANERRRKRKLNELPNVTEQEIAALIRDLQPIVEQKFNALFE